MLLPRSSYCPGWMPSWRGTNKFYLHAEDGQNIRMRLGMDTTRIWRPVVLKRLLVEEGSRELEINKLFSTEPLATNPRNHCVCLLDLIQLPGDQPIQSWSIPCCANIMIPRFELSANSSLFFAQICEVGLARF
ncbi:hypothetical protein EDB86DRAFT_2022436 [Lactarius hatsudake]|nr:hypothetical protein EDB86DRAFT_2022436 [Lactarius hatsudake]